MSSPFPGEQKLMRQQHKSDAKQKAVYDKRRRDAACYPFIIIKMERFESQFAVLLLQHLYIHEVLHVSEMHTMVQAVFESL